jgi:hypothetical protein
MRVLHAWLRHRPVLENAWPAYDTDETGIPGRIGKRAVAQIA